MTSSTIRQTFLDFFREKLHTVVPSSSLMPDSPNLLFTNAGMNQFVPYFLGTERAPFSPARAADTQKCIRAGGKHNDLDDVGLDTYHHTFFEMLGNWSFGDYFKAEAISWAWELLTERWKFPPHRLYATVYNPGTGDPGSFDQEAFDHWAARFREAGLDPAAHIVNGSKKDNFWMMGETGPCGPCSEVHVDLTPDAATRGALVNAGDPRCMEVWNLVFIQFNANTDGSFSPLPARHVDTGMGFERIAGIIQCTEGFTDFSRPISNYGSDVFQPIFARLESLSGKRYLGTVPTGKAGATEQERVDVAFRVLADHIRALAFAIADGILPGNNERNYVVRRILRRAVRFGRVLGFGAALTDGELLLPRLLEPVVETFAPVFPELSRSRDLIHDVLESEEKSFNRTLDKGLELFDAEMKRLPEGAAAFSAQVAFKLYDTYGFPVDLTELLAREAGLTVDSGQVNALMDEQRQRARTAQKKEVISAEGNLPLFETLFVGFERDEAETQLLGTFAKGADIYVGVEVSPFYAEMGGQVGDTGLLRLGSREVAVTATIRKGPAFFLKLAEPLAAEDAALVASAMVDKQRRRAIEAHHTATHLLHLALRDALGPGVMQKGSYVGPDRLRFDFNSSALNAAQLESIERQINQRILENSPVAWTEMPYASVRERSDIMQFFGEKYGDTVRVVQIGGQPGALNGYSMELCGGTHARATGQLGLFTITSEGAIAAGIRRIEAVCGMAALEHGKARLAEQTKRAEQLEEKLVEAIKELERERAAALRRQASALVATLLQQVDDSAGTKRLIKNVGIATPELLQSIIDLLKERQFDGIAILAGLVDDRVSLAVSIGAGAPKNLHAGKLMQQIAPIVGGKGGGKAESARGAGNDPGKINDALRLAATLL